jgi:superfamily II DNA/RNA helicase
MLIRTLGPGLAWPVHRELRARLPANLDAFNLAESAGAVRALPFNVGREKPWLFDARSELRRLQQPAPADVPLLACTDYPAYASFTQKRAVHAALTAPAAGVLLATLPTGAGKSLVTQLLALEPLRRGRPRMALCVVPTVALAIDQHRAALPHFERMGEAQRVAYLAGDHYDAASLQDLLDRIRCGAVSLLFTAPERLVRGPLADAVMACARQQGLAALVVDEVHLVATWGGRFRPAFQQVKEQRERLLAATPEPFPTVLLSATVTPQTATSLRELFAPDNTPFLRVDARALRPELDWVAHRLAEPEERLREAVHVLRHLPRPAIAYTTSVEDAEKLHDALVSGPMGLRRVALFTGETRGEERVRIVDDWRADKLDLVVATSAFGLGVDKPDVRAVVHATMPEGLDRFYQEAGRGGRDGYAALSCALWTPDDRDLARRNAFINVITTQKAIARWSAMAGSKPPLFGEARTVDLWRRPLYANRQAVAEERRSEGTVGWNLATLLLFERAGALRISGIDSRRDMADIVWNWMDDPAALEAAVDARRLEEQEQNARNLATMRGALEASRRECMAERLGALYGISSAAPCGRCAACRALRIQPDSAPLPEPLGTNWDRAAWGLPSPDPRLKRVLGSSGTALLLYPPEWAERTAGIERLGTLLARLGCPLSVVPDDMLPGIAEGMRRIRNAPGLLISRVEATHAGWRLPPLTAVAVLRSGDGPEALQDALAAAEGRQSDAPLVVVMPIDLSFPEHGGRPAAHEVPTACRLEAEVLVQEWGI